MNDFVEKLPYLAPTIKVASFKVERGFGDSSQVEFKIDQAEANFYFRQMNSANGQVKGFQNGNAYFGNGTEAGGYFGDGSSWGGFGNSNF